MADLSQYDPIFQAAGAEWDVDPRMLKAMATQESGGNRYARSKANAQGLMQIIPETQRHLGMTDPHDPAQSIYGGAKYLSEALSAERENPAAALLYYHGGPGWRGSYGAESRGYVPAVAAHYQRYAKADTGAASDATPASGGPAVPAAAAKSPDKSDDDPFSAALGGGSEAKPATSGAKAADDPFTAALGPPGQETAGDRPEPAERPKPTEAYTAAGSAKAADMGIPGAPSPRPIVSADVSSGGPVNWLSETGQRIGQGFASGYRGTPDILSPEGRSAVEGAPGVGLPLSLLERAGSTGLKIAGGLFGGAQAGVASAGDAVSPGLGRGLAGMMEVAPEGMRAHPLMPGAMAQVPARMTENRLANAAPLSPEFRASPMAPEMTTRIAADQSVPMTLGPDGQPVPRSVGAMAPANAVAMTPEDAAAARTTADTQWLNATKQPGVADPNEYIPGISPTMAQREQTVQAAREQKTLRNMSPEVSQAERELLDDHNQKRSDFYGETAGSEVTRANAAKVRDDKMDAALGAAFKNKTEADAAPIMQVAADIKASPDGRRPVVRNAVDRVTAELLDADGKMISDPEQLYGVRKHINDMLSKEAARDDPVSQRAAGHLISMRNAVDEAIEPAAPGFKQAITDYAEASGPIDAAEALQARESKLYDGQGRMQFSKVHALLRDVIDAQRPGAALSPFQHLSEGQMTRLKALHDDLKRSASAEDLARAYGSDTAQNAVDALKEYGKMVGTATTHGVANYISPGFGSMAVSGARNMLAPIFAARTARNQTRRGMEMLHPDPAKYPTRNLLEPPT